jgi:hypothetical protein
LRPDDFVVTDSLNSLGIGAASALFLKGRSFERHSPPPLQAIPQAVPTQQNADGTIDLLSLLKEKSNTPGFASNPASRTSSAASGVDHMMSNVAVPPPPMTAAATTTTTVTFGMLPPQTIQTSSPAMPLFTKLPPSLPQPAQSTIVVTAAAAPAAAAVIDSSSTLSTPASVDSNDAGKRLLQMLQQPQQHQQQQPTPLPQPHSPSQPSKQQQQQQRTRTSSNPSIVPASTVRFAGAGFSNAPAPHALPSPSVVFGTSPPSRPDSFPSVVAPANASTSATATAIPINASVMLVNSNQPDVNRHLSSHLKNLLNI